MSVSYRASRRLLRRALDDEICAWGEFSAVSAADPVDRLLVGGISVAEQVRIAVVELASTGYLPERVATSTIRLLDRDPDAQGLARAVAPVADYLSLRDATREIAVWLSGQIDRALIRVEQQQDWQLKILSALQRGIAVRYHRTLAVLVHVSVRRFLVDAGPTARLHLDQDRSRRFVGTDAAEVRSVRTSLLLRPLMPHAPDGAAVVQSSTSRPQLALV